MFVTRALKASDKHGKEQASDEGGSYKDARKAQLISVKLIDAILQSHFVFKTKLFNKRD